jgi:ribokinase
MSTVIVFGSINMDLVIRTPWLPAPGETLIGRTFFTAPGGKGANQAVAAARLGAATHMIGRVGNDVFAPALRASLEQYGVQTNAVQTCDGPSGVAIIAVDDAAENIIIVASGANELVGHADIELLMARLQSAGVLLLQFEVPLAMVLAAAQAARAQGVVVILDPAPACEIPEALYAATDLITPNEHEAAILTGLPVTTPEQAEQAARVLVARGARNAVVKLGGRGAIWFDGQTTHHLPPFPVTPVDTVAAGDAFNGGVAAALSNGRPMDEALRWGMAAGALAVTKVGAQQSMPSREELLALLAGTA